MLAPIHKEYQDQFFTKASPQQFSPLRLHPKKRHALVVEDNSDSRRLIDKAFTDSDYSISFAYDGYEALDLNMTLSQIDLLILDWRMPGLNGSEVLGEMEKDLLRRLSSFTGKEFPKKIPKIPFIIYSAYPYNQTKPPNTHLFFLVDYWQKPIAPDEVRSRVQKLIEVNLLN